MINELLSFPCMMYDGTRHIFEDESESNPPQVALALSGPLHGTTFKTRCDEHISKPKGH